MGLAYIFISHDLAVVKHIADRVAVMYLGRIVETAPTDELFATPAASLYAALLSAIPVPRPRARREPHHPAGRRAEPDRVRRRAATCTCAARTRSSAAGASGRALADDGGHATACHRWPELPPPTPAVPADEDARRRWSG